MERKYIFVTGGVVSGLGKGITAASLGRLMKERGYVVSMQKLDPYLNVDPGNMNPYQHGEVFVTDGGAETDLDLGHYERFIDESLSNDSSVTSGRVYWDVLTKERMGDYGGGTVQVVPHITNHIKEKIQNAPPDHCEIAIIEIGGTVGDIESLPFIEAIRQFATDVGRNNSMFVHVTLLPRVTPSNELKTKPTQHSVKTLLSNGIQPDVIVARCDEPVDEDIRSKIALFCNVGAENVIPNYDVEVLYEVPLAMERENFADIVCKRLGLPASRPDLTSWKAMVERQKNPANHVNIALVGKYILLRDAYLSIVEALTHGGIANNCGVNIQWIDSEQLNESNYEEMLTGVGGILVPGGFGSRGIGGKLLAARYAREHKVAFLGICLGMQLAVVEFARNVLNMKGAASTEFEENALHPVIDLMPGQENLQNTGGTMRLGKYPCVLDKNSRIASIYEETTISERHRHRFEVNNKYRQDFENAGLHFSGLSPDGELAEAMEIASHPYFMGVQFHPEFKSRPNRPHPMFASFVEAAMKLL